MALRHGYRTSAGASALATLDAWDAQLAHVGAQLVAARLNLLRDIAPLVARNYAELAPHSRPAQLSYTSIPQITVEDCAASLPLDEEYLEAALLAGLAENATMKLSAASPSPDPTATTSPCCWACNPRKALRATGNPGVSPSHCGSPPTIC
ncbi:MAG: hypothetical protein U1U88_001346 [Lawsonella clevelandensis]